jgi:hypothetical protein
MNADRIERRRALRLLLALGMVGLRAAPLQAANAERTATLMAGIDMQALRDLAEQYRQIAPADAADAEIHALLQDKATSLEDTLARLRQLIAADFQHGRVVHLGGWFLSRTEGCVLAVASGPASTESWP